MTTTDDTTPTEKTARKGRRRRMKARKRQPAHFDVEGRSSVFPDRKILWRVKVTTLGVEATRDMDHRRVAIEWDRLIGLAMFYGHDSEKGAQR